MVFNELIAHLTLDVTARLASSSTSEDIEPREINISAVVPTLTNFALRGSTNSHRGFSKTKLQR
jgi:hypothetical protein